MRITSTTDIFQFNGRFCENTLSITQIITNVIGIVLIKENKTILFTFCNIFIQAYRIVH